MIIYVWVGFAAYANTNPFLTAASTNSKMGGFGFGFGSPPAMLTVSVSATKSISLPELNVSSPKSPKPNPFSSPSPAHNPFMTIVESKDELWQTMAQDKLTHAEAEKMAKKPKLSHSNAPGIHYSSSYFGEAFVEREQEIEQETEENKKNLVVEGVSTGAADDSLTTPAKDSISIAVGDDNGATADNGDEEGEDAQDEEQKLEGEVSPGRLYATYSLPENVVVVTGEEDDECTYHTRAKLYRLGIKSSTGVSESDHSLADDKQQSSETTADGKVVTKSDAAVSEWIEVGVGPVKVLRQNNIDEVTGRRSTRLVIRREDKKGGIGELVVFF
jgi:hypothetical protein